MLLATSPHFPLKWHIGQHHLSMTSVGFETRATPRGAVNFRSGAPLKIIGRLLEALTVGTAYQSRMILEALAIKGPNAEVGLLEQSAPVTIKRYETGFGTDELAKIGLKDIDDLHSVARGERKFFDRFIKIGRAAAARSIETTHFPEAFDVRIPVDISAALSVDGEV
jgi:hypothetical protein